MTKNSQDEKQTQRDERFKLKPLPADDPIYSIGYAVQMQSIGKGTQGESEKGQAAQDEKRPRMKTFPADDPFYSIGYAVQLQTVGKTRQPEADHQEEDQGGDQDGLSDKP